MLWGSTGGELCPGSDWQGLMTFPRVVELDPQDSSRLISFPLPEISALWTNSSTSTNIELAAGATYRLPASFGGNQLDVTFGFNASASAPRTFGVRVLAPPRARGVTTGGVNVSVSTTPDSAVATLGGGAVSAPRASSPASRTNFQVSGPTIDLRILVDHALVEIFAEGGRSTATSWLCAPSPVEDVGVEIFNLGPGTLIVREVTSRTVASVNRLPWEPAANTLS